MPNRDSDTVSNIKKKCKFFQTELRTLAKKKSNKLTKKLNQEQLKLHRSSLSTDILNYNSKLFTFFNNRYDSAISEYIHELEPGKKHIGELVPYSFSCQNDETDQTTDLLYNLVLNESQRQPSSCSSTTSPSSHGIGPPQTSSTPCIQNVEIAEPAKKKTRVDSVGPSRSTLGSPAKKQTRKRYARKTITHVSNNNADKFASRNIEQNNNSENSVQTDIDHQENSIQTDMDHDTNADSNFNEVERHSLNLEDFDSSDSDEEPYSPTTREKRLQYSIDKDYRPEDENQSTRILTDVESIADILAKALEHECRPTNNFNTRRQSQPIKPTPVLQIHHKSNPETKGINLKVHCETCDETVYNNTSMVNEKFLIKNTAVWISLLFGQSYRESQAFYALLGLPFYKDPGTFYSHRRKIAKLIAAAKSSYFRKYRKRAFNHIKNRDNFVMINGQKRRKLEVVSLDGSWNTRGWHAFDCIMYVIDPNSKLVISCHHVNVNEQGHTSQQLETDLMKQVFAESLVMDNGQPVIIESMIIDGDSKRRFENQNAIVLLTQKPTKSWHLRQKTYPNLIYEPPFKGYKKVKYTYCSHFGCDKHGHLHTIDEIDSDDSDFNENEADTYLDLETTEDSIEENTSGRRFVTRSQMNPGQQINSLTTQRGEIVDISMSSNQISDPISLQLDSTVGTAQQLESNSINNSSIATSSSTTVIDNQIDDDEAELRVDCLPGVNLVVKYKADSGHACKLIRKKLEELAVRFKKTKMASYKASGIGGRGNWANEENRKKIERNVRACLSQLQLHTESITTQERDDRIQILKIAMEGALFHNFRLQNCNVISFMLRLRSGELILKLWGSRK